MVPHGDWLTDGRRLLVWEYPRQAPDGDQVDLVEVMEIDGGLIACHRIYWGLEGLHLDCTDSRETQPHMKPRACPAIAKEDSHAHTR